MENLFDFTNYRVHPTNTKYNVYHYTKREQAEYFETLLIEHKLEYERHNEKKDEGAIFYFAVKRSDEKLSNRLNHLCIGRYRRKFIPDGWLRYSVMFISFIVLTMAIIGFLKSR